MVLLPRSVRGYNVLAGLDTELAPATPIAAGAGSGDAAAAVAGSPTAAPRALPPPAPMPKVQPIADELVDLVGTGYADMSDRLIIDHDTRRMRIISGLKFDVLRVRGDGVSSSGSPPFVCLTAFRNKAGNAIN